MQEVTRHSYTWILSRIRQDIEVFVATMGGVPSSKKRNDSSNFGRLNKPLRVKFCVTKRPNRD